MKNGFANSIGWKTFRLGEVADINPRPGNGHLEDDSLASFIPMKCVEEESGRFMPLGDRKVAEVRKGYTPFRDGDVIFAKVTPCMENGKAAVMKGLTNGIGFGSTEFFALRPTERLDANFLLHFLLQNSFRQKAARNMTGAVGLRRVPKSYLEQQAIPLPPIEEQSRIVAEIEKQFTRLDAGVAALRRVQANLKRYRAGVLKAASEGCLVPTEAELARAEGSSYEPADKLLARILTERRQKWSGRGKYKEPVSPDPAQLHSLPEGWTWITIDQMLAQPLCNGISIKGSDNPPGVRALRLSAMSEYGFDYANSRYLPLADSDVDDLWIQEGDFFMSRGNGSLHLVGRGTVAQKAPVPTIFPDTMIRLRFAREIKKSGWIPTLWPSRMIRSQIEREVKTTAGIFKIAQPQVERMTIPLPPLSEQKRIVAEVERRLSVIDQLEAVVTTNLQRATRLRQSVLQKAFAYDLVGMGSATS